MSTLSEYVDKLRTLAEGALRTIDEKRVKEVQKPIFTDHERQRNWWDGYYQAILDVTAEMEKQAAS